MRVDHPAAMSEGWQMRPAGILFYDGFCGLCSTAVRFLMKIDTRQSLMFSPLQGLKARSHLLPFMDSPVSPRSLVFLSFRSGKIFLMSDAVIESTASLEGFWAGARILKVIPRRVRDALYSWIARARYRISGELKTCWIPEGNERSRFLE